MDGCATERPTFWRVTTFSSPLNSQHMRFVTHGWEPNRPFNSCVHSVLAFDWKRGWWWPCFETNLTAFHIKIMLRMMCHSVMTQANSEKEILSSEWHMRNERKCDVIF